MLIHLPSGTCSKAGNAVPVVLSWRKKLWPGFSWWLMPHNQSIGQWRSEIRSWSRWPEELNHPSLSSSLSYWTLGAQRVHQTLLCWQSRQMLSVCLSGLAYYDILSRPLLSLSLFSAAWRTWSIARGVEDNSEPPAPFKVSGPQTKLPWRWVMGSTGPRWICFEDFER